MNISQFLFLLQGKPANSDLCQLTATRRRVARNYTIFQPIQTHKFLKSNPPPPPLLLLSLLSLTELPAMSTIVTQHERGHRLIRGSRLQLVVRAVPPLALAALEQIRLRALDSGQLRVIDRLLHEPFPQILHLVAGHLLGRHLGQFLRGYCAAQVIRAQRGILRVLQVGHPRPDAVLVAHVRVLELEEDRLLQLLRQLLGTGAHLRVLRLQRGRQHLLALDPNGVGHGAAREGGLGDASASAFALLVLLVAGFASLRRGFAGRGVVGAAVVVVVGRRGGGRRGGGLFAWRVREESLPDFDECLGEGDDLLVSTVFPQVVYGHSDAGVGQDLQGRGRMRVAAAVVITYGTHRQVHVECLQGLEQVQGLGVGGLEGRKYGTGGGGRLKRRAGKSI